MNRIKLTIEYDGSQYHGFQSQKNATTIQDEIANGIHKLSGQYATIIGASRTDTGVHAMGQIVAFNTSVSIPADKWEVALNSVLPKDIRIIESCGVDPQFHPRFDAVSKSYIYLICREKQGRVFLRNYALCNLDTLNVPRMQKACTFIEGKHNFKSFCASGSSVKTYEREVKLCSINEKGPFIYLHIKADGFLYNMVRIIVGTLMEVGREKYPAEYIKDLIIAEDRTKAPMTAKPQGLYLMRVYYNEEEERKPLNVSLKHSGFLY